MMLPTKMQSKWKATLTTSMDVEVAMTETESTEAATFKYKTESGFCNILYKLQFLKIV